MLGIWGEVVWTLLFIKDTNAVNCSAVQEAQEAWGAWAVSVHPVLTLNLHLCVPWGKFQL